MANMKKLVTLSIKNSEQGEMMRVVVTGASGLVGTYLQELLKYTGIECVALSRSKKEGYVQTDYSVDSLTSILEEKDALVHLAANRSSSRLLSDFTEDMTATQNLYEVAREKNIANIVFASSISVYSDVTELPWSETSKVQPVSTYGIVKRTLELLGEKYNRDYEMNIKNLRLAHLFGPGEQNNYMINLFFRKALNKQQLALNTQSTSKREFLYVKDACEAILHALKHPTESGSYNVGSTIQLTNYEVASEINTVFENQGNLLVKDESQPDNVKPSIMSSEAFRTTFGSQNHYTFNSALQEIKEDLERLEHVPEFY